MTIQVVGHGKFKATNGVDIINARYARGKKQLDGQFHPAWFLTVWRETAQRDL